jgi:hypothetical protein
MRMSFYKKIITSILILSFILPSLFIPQRVKATAPVFDYSNLGTNLANLVENAISAVAEVGTLALEYSMLLKEYVLDTLAYTLAKMIVRQLSQSIINWINSGFEGSPSFVQDPSAFFLDIADQLTGDFLDQYGGPLTDLCSPFSIDLRLALAYKYHPKGQATRYKCTLGKIIQNGKSAVANASINGFTAGDFKQGGWPAFISMTTEPQNNIYTAYLHSDAELSLRIGGIQIEKQQQLMQGNGFLSFPDPACRKAAKAMAAQAQAVYDGTGDGEIDPNLVTFNQKKETWSADTSGCPVTTPGQAIKNSLLKQMDSGTDQLNIADEIGEIIDALIAQLATQILQAGLSSVSQKNSSGSSYLSEMVKEMKNTPEVESLKSSILSNMPAYISNANIYKATIVTGINFVKGISDSYKAVQACYLEKINAVPSILFPSEVTEAQSRIQNIQNILNGDLSATTTRLINLSTKAQGKIDALRAVEASTTAAETMSELYLPATLWGRLIKSTDPNSKPIDAIDIRDANKAYSNLQEAYKNLIVDARNKMNICSSFPFNIRND